MATPVGPAHHAACPQAFHSYIQHQHHHHHQQQPWSEQFMMHAAPHSQSPIDDVNAAKLDQHSQYPYRGEWSAALRQQQQQQQAQTSGYHDYPTSAGEGQPCFQHPRPASDMPASSAAPFPYINTATSATSNTLTIPSPPPSDGSPRAEWAAFAQSEPDSKGRDNQVGFNRNSPILRPDGVRKKNAKFDIPAERNLDTLDDMIKGAKSDTERKEYKMQKRLLRNREAALHSRQKKKNHTESLERENSSLAAKINELQHQVTNLEIQVDDHGKEREALKRQASAAEDRARRLQEEKDAYKAERAQFTSEIEHLRAQLRSTATRTSPGGGLVHADAAAGAEAGVGFGVDAWPEPGFDMMSDLYLEPGKLQQGRADDAKPSVIVH